MRYYFVCILTCLLIVLGSSCRKDLEYASSTGNLEFSKDTVFLDTIFASIGSTTHTLKIYNRNNDDVEIPAIRLAKGQNSKYRLNVDGVAGKEFDNVPIFAKDSIFIFIETNVAADDAAENEFLYTDIIQFDTGDNLQEVQLVTLVKDAIFIHPKTLADGKKEFITLGLNESGEEIRVAGSDINDNQLEFTNEKPYVIYGYAKVSSGKELIVNSGARVHFHKDAGIYVESGASIKINGVLSEDQEVLEGEVIFEGDRLENEYTTIPGQWGSIWIAAGSSDNSINYLTLKNATIGLFVEGDGLLESPTLTIQNAQIYNNASINLWAKTAFINAQNLVLGNSGRTSLYCYLGGKYSFKHCTIANYWSDSFRLGAALEIDNFNSNQSADLLQADFINCIIDGNSFLEIALASNELNSFSYAFKNCALKFRDESNIFNGNPLYDFENTSRYNQILLNKNLNFLNTQENDFRIDSDSEASNKADINTALSIPFDILGIDRTTSPSIGAYQTLQ